MHSLRGSEPTDLEAVGCEWRYALLVVQTRNDDDDDDDCIGSTLGKLSRVLSTIREIETLNKNVSEFFNMSKFRKIFYITLAPLPTCQKFRKQ